MELRKNQNIRIGDVLKEFGYVTDADIDRAVAYQKEHQGCFNRIKYYNRKTDVDGSW